MSLAQFRRLLLANRTEGVELFRREHATNAQLSQSTHPHLSRLRFGEFTRALLNLSLVDIVGIDCLFERALCLIDAPPDGLSLYSILLRDRANFFQLIGSQLELIFPIRALIRLRLIALRSIARILREHS